MSNIILKRLYIIAHEGKIVYDQVFHKGVNIIRGSNGTGKSTISDFIYFILGGDFQNWKKEASECKDVYGEVEFNNAVTTIRREISSSRQQGMYIFEGNLQDALQDYYKGWKLYPYKKTEEKSSFSNYLFSMLDFPQIKTGEADSNLTFHQILRLLYIDQESPSLSFFKFEQLFDSGLTRSTIEEILLGVYEDKLYSDRLNLKKLQKQNDDQEREIKSITKTFNSVDSQYKFEKIDEEIANLSSQILEIDKRILLLNLRSNNTTEKDKESKESIVFQLQNTLTPLKKSAVGKEDKKNRLFSEVEDSKDFIKVLEDRVNSINQSIKTREILGAIQIQFCPNCYKPLNPKDSAINHCYVCQNPITAEEEALHLSRMKQEAILQIEESKRIIKRKSSEISKLQDEIIEVKKTIKDKQDELNTLLINAKSVNQEEIEKEILNKGKLLATIDFLTKYSKMFMYFQSLMEENEKIKIEITKLDNSIKGKVELQRKKQYIAKREIENFAKQILKEDTENEFNIPEKIEYSAEFNNYKFNGRLNYSASSNVILKNSIRFALFFASCTEVANFMRFPRFILCDNIEDKGMQEIRSQNFQKVIVEMSKSIKVDFQIIFSTSMINPELDKREYTIGEFYDKDNKALKVK